MNSYKQTANVNDSYTELLTELHTIAQYDNGTADALYIGMDNITISKASGKWAIFINGQMVEGGFSSRLAAVEYARKEYGLKY